MKFDYSKTSISSLIERNNFISIVLNSIFNLFFFSIRKICRLFPNTNRNIVIISLHRLGDTIFTIPAIKEIQKHFNKKIIIACYPESVPLYELAFDDIRFCELERHDFIFNDRLPKFIAKKKLKLTRPELIFDLTGSWSSASLIFNLRTIEIVGMNNLQFKAIYDHYLKIRESPQLTDIYLDVISSVVTSSRQKANKENIQSN